MGKRYEIKASKEAKKVHNKIEAASNIEDEKLSDAVNALNDDFDYAMSGIEKLSRSGAQATNDAMVIVESLSGAVNEVISRIAEAVPED